MLFYFSKAQHAYFMVVLKRSEQGTEGSTCRDPQPSNRRSSGAPAGKREEEAWQPPPKVVEDTAITQPTGTSKQESMVLKD